MTDPQLDQKVWGLDVSYAQGTVNWNVVAQQGYKFAFIKATEGISLTDPQFSNNWAGAKTAGLLRGAYHFYHPKDDPRQQAEHFLNTAWPAGGNPLLASGDLPPVLDIEVSDSQSAQQIVQGIQVWLTLVQQATLRIPILYTNRGFWNTLNTQQFGKYPLWVAEYDVAAPTTLPAGWTNWLFWQFSTSGQIDGLSSNVPNPNVDLDMFNGSLQDLQQRASSLAMPWL